MNKVEGIILRTADRQKLSQFFLALGLNLDEHRHGSGPIHSGCEDFVPNPVLEIYKKSDRFPCHALMVSVDSIEEALLAVKSLTEIPVSIEEIKGDDKLRFVYVQGPGELDVMLVEHI